jgi:branched-subunit amino acid ABC-type transport system permease component
MLDVAILLPSFLNGVTTGAVYALIALGLTLIYGVLHIINFAHGAALMVALYAVYFLKTAPASTLTWRCRSSCRRCSRSATACSGS